MGESGWDVTKKEMSRHSRKQGGCFPLCMRSGRRKQAALLGFSFFNGKVGGLPYSVAQVMVPGDARCVVGKTGRWL